MPVTNRQLAKRFIHYYPKTNYYLETLLVNASRFLKSKGKLNRVTGETDTDKYLNLISSNLCDIIKYSEIEGIYFDIRSREDVLDVISDLISTFENINPNWQAEYAIIRNILENEEIFYGLYGNIIDSIVERYKENPVWISELGQTKHTLTKIFLPLDDENFETGGSSTNGPGSGLLLIGIGVIIGIVILMLK